MFEDMNYENILKKALNSVASDVDKREGSIIFDALSPAALELAEVYRYMDDILNNSFADTAYRDCLVLRAKERGIEPYEANKALLQLEVTFEDNGNLSYGDKFSANNLDYTVVEGYGENGNPNWYTVECDTEGEIGNSYIGDVLPTKNIEGLISAKITKILVSGRDAEYTEDFRQRYFDSINIDRFGGNKADYIEWVKAIDGVGQVKVSRTPAGGGTVGITVLGSDNTPVSQELLSTIKQKLDPTDGYGDGIAPIGHKVTVTSAAINKFDVYLNFVLEIGADTGVIENKAIELINNYVNEINAGWEDGVLRIYSAKILSLLIDIDGVINVTDLYFNDNEEYLEAAENEIFALDTLNP